MSTVEIGRSAPLAARSAEWLRLARLAKLLAWISLAWLCIEGSVAVAAGIIAGSIALVGFGLDSAIEGLASFIVVWALLRRPHALRNIGTTRAATGRPQLFPPRPLRRRRSTARARRRTSRRNQLARDRPRSRITPHLPWPRRLEATHRHATRLGRDPRRGKAEPALRRPRRRRPRRPTGQHALWPLVARPCRCAHHLRRRHPGRCGSLAWHGLRRLLLTERTSALVRNPMSLQSRGYIR